MISKVVSIRGNKTSFFNTFPGLEASQFNATKKNLQKIVGPENMTCQEKDLAHFSHTVIIKNNAAIPLVIVTPTSNQQISEILRLANKTRTPIIPLGGKTSLTGGCTPVKGGIVVSLDKFRDITIDTNNNCVIAGAGALIGDIQNDASRVSLELGFDPVSACASGSEKTCATVGGVFNTNAGGPKALVNGVVRDNVLGATIMTPAIPEPTDLGGRYQKNSTYGDLLQSFIGVEGTYGLVTQVIFKLKPLPKYTTVILGQYSTLETAVSTIEMGRAIPITSKIELMGPNCGEIMAKKLGWKQTPPAQILFELRSDDNGFLEANVTQLLDTIKPFTTACLVARNKTQQDAITDGRSEIGDLLRHQLSFDPVLPLSTLTEFVTYIRNLEKQNGIKIICFAHAGDGNFHIIFPKPTTYTDEKWKIAQQKIANAMFTEVQRLGGTLSGEHGIGTKCLPYMNYACQDSTSLFNTLKMVNAYKRCHDPNGIMNPGVRDSHTATYKTLIKQPQQRSKL